MENNFQKLLNYGNVIDCFKSYQWNSDSHLIDIWIYMSIWFIVTVSQKFLFITELYMYRYVP